MIFQGINIRRELARKSITLFLVNDLERIDPQRWPLMEAVQRVCWDGPQNTGRAAEDLPANTQMIEEAKSL